MPFGMLRLVRREASSWPKPKTWLPRVIEVSREASVYKPGVNVCLGTDQTLFALVTGKVKFDKKGAEKRTFVSVLPE